MGLVVFAGFIDLGEAFTIGAGFIIGIGTGAFTVKDETFITGSIAEMERNRIKERQAEGIVLAKALGKFQGRKIGSTISDVQLLERHPNIVKKLKKELSVREVAEIVNCSTTTVMKVKKILDKQNKVG